jgi:hypothetical protein
MVNPLPNQISKSKIIKTENKSVKQRQTAQERPKQTRKTRRSEQKSKEISSTRYQGFPA